MPRANMRDLSFATFNLFNLQVPGGITYGTSSAIPDTPEGREEYQAKIDWTAAQLQRLDTEVIGFQELWAKEALVDAFTAAGLADEYDLVARDSPGRGRPQVALAVRKDRHGESQLLPGADWEPNFPPDFRFDEIRETDGAAEEITITLGEFSRPVLKAQIQAEGRGPKPPVVTVYVAHLKSKGPARVSFPDDLPTILATYPNIAKSALAHVRRVLEAGALRAMLDEVMVAEDEDALSPVVVMGDLNDGTLSVTNELISDQPTYRVVEKSTAGRSSNKGLYSAEQLQQLRSLRHVYYTYTFKNKLESLDHILVSEEFYDHSRKRQWSFREMEVFNDHVGRSEDKAAGAGDHGLVKAYFDWNPMPREIDVA
ncbi:MAG: endonuclease/exonuclease/phosphatase family protein [Pseudomonadota bacterium]